MFKFLVWHVLIVTASCELFKEESGYVLNYAPIYTNYKPRDYQFDYAVSDPHSGDHKSQWEVKINGVVRGAYSLLEPDGTTRIVEYVADDDGFRAVVKKVGTAVHPVPVVPPVSYRSYDGQITNYIPQLENHGTVGFVGGENLGLGTIQQVPLQNHEIPIQQVQLQEHRLNGVGNVNIQGQTLTDLPLSQVSVIQGVPDLRRREDQALLQGHNLRSQVVPNFEGQIGAEELSPRSDLPLLQSHNLHTHVIPSIGQNLNLGQTGAQVPELDRRDDVSLLQGHTLRAQPNIEGQVEVVSSELSHRDDLFQGHTLQAQLIPNRRDDLLRLQGHDLRAQSNIEEQSRVAVPELGRRDDLVLIQGHTVGAQPNVQEQIRLAIPELGRRDNLPLFQGHTLQAQVVPTRRDDLSLLQGHSLSAQPNIEGQIGVRVPELGRRDDLPLLQEHTLQAQVVPNREGQTGVPAPELIRREDLSQLQRLQGHAVTSQVIPNFQGQTGVPLLEQQRQNLPNLEGQGLDNLKALQGEIARLVNTGQLEVVPPLQRPSLGVNLRVPYRGQNVDLPQPQIEIVSSRGQEQVPVDPSYRTVIEYQGLGNDNRLKKDVYHSSYSEKVLKVVPSPRKSIKKAKKDFLIYYPESERQ